MKTRSKPSTPPPKEPSNRRGCRFELLNKPTEWIELYRPGGFHPLHPGDSLPGDRYTIVCKLGNGSYSTVCLAQDKESVLRLIEEYTTDYFRISKLVAIKVARADATGVDKELQLYEQIVRSEDISGAMRHVVTFIDDFKQMGPNGEHQCMVFEPMGPSAYEILEGLVSCESKQAAETLTYASNVPPPCAFTTEASPPSPLPTLDDSPSRQDSPSPSSVSPPGSQYSEPVRGPSHAALPLQQREPLLKQLLLGIHFLHSSGIAHGDVNPGNLLLSIRPLSHDDVQSILASSDESGKSAPVKRIDGKEDRWAPRHLYVGQPLAKWVDLDGGMMAKVSDLGAAFSFSNPPTTAQCVTPVALRAPEIILNGQATIDHKIDIWSFGCLLFEFLTGAPLFYSQTATIFSR